MRLTEAEFIEIEERAARKFREWERNYAPQDIRLEHHLSWWIAQEVAEHLSHKDEIHAPSVEARYRLLEAGEIVASGDEFIGDDGVTWEPVKGWPIGYTYTHIFKSCRRALPPLSANS